MSQFVLWLLLSSRLPFSSHVNAHKLSTLTCVMEIVRDCWGWEANIQSLSSLCFFLFLTGSMDVLSNAISINYNSSRRLLKNRSCCLLLNMLWREPITNGSFVINVYKGAKFNIEKQTSLCIYIQTSAILFPSSLLIAIKDTSIIIQAGRVCMGMLSRRQTGLRSEILWNGSSGGHLRQGNWADCEAGLQLKFAYLCNHARNIYSFACESI